MKNKLLVLALGAVLSSGVLATTASAVVVLPGSVTSLNLAGTAGDGLYEGIVSTAPTTKNSKTVTKFFDFVGVAGFPTVDVDVSPSGGTYAGPTIGTWQDLAGGAVVTLNNLATNIFSVIVGHTYRIVFTVTHLPSPTNSAITSSFTVTPSPVPVPPAAVLLLSGLLGIGALGRKRSGKVSV
jgi:hypothetical protein